MATRNEDGMRKFGVPKFGTPLDGVFAERLRDLLDGADPLESANTLARLAYLQVVKACPGKPTKDERGQIKQDSIRPTDADIDTFSLSPRGMLMATFISAQLLNMMVAHSALAYAADNEAHDTTLPESAFADLQQQIETACEHGVGNGITPYGAASTVLNHVMAFGLRHNVHPFQLVRPLKHCLEVIQTEFTNSGRKSPSQEDLLIELAARLGGSKVTAKKYIKGKQ